VPLISHENLKEYVKRIFIASGSNPQEAELVADYLVRANLAGVDSHGIIRIPDYVQMVEQGKMRPNVVPKIVRDRGAMATVDAGLGYGQVAAKMAMELAMKKAREYGIGSVAVYNCNHAGRIAEYPLLAAENGMIGMLMVKAFGSIVAPWGGKGRILSTSPMSFAIPASSEPPIVADFATSMSAEGKVRVKNARGEKIPIGWVLNSEGKPTDNPADLYSGGALLPFGESKGYALNLLMESVGAALSGAGILDSFSGSNGVFALAINIEFFSDPEEFKTRVDTMIKTIRASPPADGVKEVLIPGDPEMRETKKRMANGINVEDKTWVRVVEVGTKYHVPLPEVAPSPVTAPH
jgi:LDH2 family malate/lactate/ureidoglycolate dehydrogenase